MADQTNNFLVVVTTNDDIAVAWDILTDLSVEVKEDNKDDAVSIRWSYGAGCSFDKEKFLAAAKEKGLSAKVINAYSA